MHKYKLQKYLTGFRMALPPPPQAASSPPQGPNTLHIYIGAHNAASTVQLLSFFLFRNGNSFSHSSSLLLMRAVLPESHY